MLRSEACGEELPQLEGSVPAEIIIALPRELELLKAYAALTHKHW